MEWSSHDARLFLYGACGLFEVCLLLTAWFARAREKRYDDPLSYVMKPILGFVFWPMCWFTRMFIAALALKSFVSQGLRRSMEFGNESLWLVMLCPYAGESDGSHDDDCW